MIDVLLRENSLLSDMHPPDTNECCFDIDTLVSNEDTDTSVSDVDSKTVYNNKVVFDTDTFVSDEDDKVVFDDNIPDGAEVEMPVVKEEKITEDEYSRFTQPYQDAMLNLHGRIQVLDHDYRRRSKNYAIHNTQTRIKTLNSAVSKLERKNLIPSLENIRKYLYDIAGIRIICYFVEDVYSVANLLKQQSDIQIIAEDDYIKNPKESGYRSYHMVLGIPVYYVDGKQYYPVEVQIRTMSMDFWASMDHRISYKKEGDLSEKTRRKLYQYSEMLSDIERKMHELCVKNN